MLLVKSFMVRSKQYPYLAVTSVFAVGRANVPGTIARARDRKVNGWVKCMAKMFKLDFSTVRV
jgi:hypothetical protein